MGPTLRESILGPGAATWETERVPRQLSRGQVQELARSIRLVLDQIDGGELAASAATTYRLEGAVVALLTALGERSEDLVEDLLRQPW